MYLIIFTSFLIYFLQSRIVVSVEGFEPINTVIKSHVLCQTELHTQNKKSHTEVWDPYIYMRWDYTHI